MDVRPEKRYPLLPHLTGGGQGLEISPNTLNAFVEPQCTSERKGDGLPQFTLFAGINVTFGK